jgi:hypothetical protein
MKSTGINQMFSLFLCLIFFSSCLAGYWGDNPNISVEHQKMISTIEYAGEGQFQHQVETLLKIEKEALSSEKTRYIISSPDFDLAQTQASRDPASNYITFIVDKNTGQMSNSSNCLTLMEKVNNHCASILQKVTKGNIGKTWKQPFDLSLFEYSLTKNITFTMTAINVNTNKYGSMTAVRALSEPFVISVVNSDGKIKEVESRIRAAYLFDSQIEDIYLSMSVFEASADIESKNEKLRYEVATYKTDASGNAVDMSGLGKDFEDFVRKVGLTSQDLKVEKETALPAWAKSEGLHAAQLSNICAAAACEGALNPVTTVTMPAARTVALQSTNEIISAGKVTTVSSILAKSVPALGGMKIAVAPAWAGYSLITATNVTALAGATAGGVAIVENNSNGGDNTRSPSVP